MVSADRFLRVDTVSGAIPRPFFMTIRRIHAYRPGLAVDLNGPKGSEPREEQPLAAWMCQSKTRSPYCRSNCQRHLVRNYSAR